MQRCDFCYCECHNLQECSTVEGHHIRMIVKGNESIPNLEFDRDWLVCPVCANLFVWQKWDALAFRAMSEMKMLHDKPVEIWLRALWSQAFSLPDILQSMPAS